MPTYLQGDIFRTALNDHYDLAVVFGYLGLNEMAQAWRNAQRQVPEWNDIGDPFAANNPMQIAPRRWFWFVSAQQNHGIGDEALRTIFEDIFQWMRKNKLNTVVTNGISNIYKGMGTDANRNSDNLRVRLINDIITNYEREGFQVTLISLNDAYTRVFPQ